VTAALLVALVACCGSKRQEKHADHVEAPVTLNKLDPHNDAAAWCVTKGVAALGARVDDPTVRAVARGSGGDAASVTFTFVGQSTQTRALASGQLRRQIGLKLRAENGCNLIYVMWRLDPKPFIEVSVKRNPGMRTNEECGANGYTKLKRPDERGDLPDLEAGSTHTLRAAIEGDELTAWVDDKLMWRGALPDEARELKGPAGVRSDNLAFDLVAFAAPAGNGPMPEVKCVGEESD
jgi:hypothetical protein